MNNYIVYKHTSPSGRVYIGVTQFGDEPEKRWRKGRHYEHCVKFIKAVKKYGWDNIKHEVLFENITKGEAFEKEIELIAHYKKVGKCYNILDGGIGGSGGKLSDEGRRKLSERMKLNNPTTGMTDEWRQHIAESQRGKKMSREFCLKTSERMKANNPMKNEDVAKKVSVKKKGGHMPIEFKIKLSKPCILCDLDGNEIACFFSLKECAKYIGCSDSSIADILHGRRKTIFKKYIVKYA